MAINTQVWHPGGSRCNEKFFSHKLVTLDDVYDTGKHFFGVFIETKSVVFELLYVHTHCITPPVDLYRPFKSSSAFFFFSSWSRWPDERRWFCGPVALRPQVRGFHYVDFPRASHVLGMALCWVVSVWFRRPFHCSAAWNQNLWINEWLRSALYIL